MIFFSFNFLCIPMKPFSSAFGIYSLINSTEGGFSKDEIGKVLGIDLPTLKKS